LQATIPGCRKAEPLFALYPLQPCRGQDVAIFRTSLISHTGDHGMKRILLSALSVSLVAALIALTGCDSGGVDPGMGDPNKADIPTAKVSDMANMANGATPPPSVKKIPEKGPGATPDAEKDKDAAKK
jgi:hypothetical protein